jgi:signal transduction histidine kinase
MLTTRALEVLYLCKPSHLALRSQIEAALSREFDPVCVHWMDVQAADFQSQLPSTAYDLILAQYELGDITGVDAWNLMPHTETTIPFVILFDKEAGEAASVDVMRSGVSECVFQEDFQRLGYIVQKLMQVWDAQQARMQADAELVVSRQRLLKLTEKLHDRINAERAAISREIHDDIGGALAAVKFDLGWIARQTQDEQVKERVNEATVMVQQALEASQRIMLNLRPAILDEGLVPALQWMANGFQKRTGAKVIMTFNTEVIDLSEAVQIVAFSVVRESLTNTFKHAQASNVWIDVSDQSGVLTVEIGDDGIGMPPKALSKENSFGILGLRERAQSVGGWLDIGSREGGGVAVVLSVPLAGADAMPFKDEDEEDLL